MVVRVPGDGSEMSGMCSFLDRSKPLRVVLDTNVVMALWHFVDPKLVSLAAFVTSDRVTLLTRADCLEELRRVFAYAQFGIDPRQQLVLYAEYVARVQCVPDADVQQQAFALSLPRCGDKDDQKFVNLAWDAAADVLVTRDKLLLKLARRRPLCERLAILTPERLEVLLAAEAVSG